MLTKLAALKGSRQERWAAEAKITTGQKRDGEIRKRCERRGEKRGRKTKSADTV